MKIFYLIFWGVIIYFGFKTFKQFFQKMSGETQVKGKPKQKTLDIDESKIEDADFEELDEK